MAIDLVIRASTAERDEQFRGRVRSRMIDLAMSAPGATVRTPADAQARRLALAKAIALDTAPYVASFAWWLVSISSYNIVEDITDQQMINNLQLTGAFDTLADLLMT